MASVSLRVRYRPVRIGWCVESGQWEHLRSALTLTTVLAGGRFNPIIPIDAPELAEALIDRFRVDLLYPIAGSEAIRTFLESHDYLVWPEFKEPSLFHARWEHIPAHAKFVDVYHAMRRLGRRRSFRRKALRITWEADDPLSTLLLAVVGAYPAPSELCPDYEAMATDFLRPQAVHVGREDSIPVIRGRITPSLLTTAELELDGPVPDHGFYVGDCCSFDDILTFWNLRAAGAGVAFVDPKHLHRFGELLTAHREWLSKAAVRTWQRDGTVTVYGRWRLDDRPDLTFIGDRVMRHTLDTVSRNGLNIVPALAHWREHSVLGAADMAERRPSLTFALPPKPVFDEPPLSMQWLVATASGSDPWKIAEHATFFPPYVPELNKYYGRELHFLYAQVRAEPRDIWDRVSLLVRTSQPDVTLRALPHSELCTKLFGQFGIKATPSDAGIVTSRLIAQMGGVQGCRVFKITGVRKLIGKYSPDQWFTRSGAIQAIRDVDPVTNTPSFDAFKELFIAPRDHKKTLAPQDVLEYLLERGVFRVGLEFRCTNCELTFWQPLDDVKERVECQYCGTTFSIARQLRDRDWAFRRSGLFGRDDHQRGGIPVAVTIQQLDANLTFAPKLFSTSLLLEPSLDGLGPCETDVVMMTAGPSHQRPHVPQLLIAECKAAGRITADDARKLGAIADILPSRRLSVFILFSKLGEFTSEEVEACALAQHKWKSRVILLSQKELEPYDLYEKHAEEPRLRTTGLEDLAENTTSLYQQLRPQGWDELAAADAARVAAVQASAASDSCAANTTRNE
jgi:hypothetical protein